MKPFLLGEYMRKLVKVTQEEIKEKLFYDPISGLFTRIANPKSKVGSLWAGGYLRISFNNISYPAHRLAWLYVTGVWPDHEIDHINRNKSDNRWNNLRLASASQNQANKSLTSINRLSAKGVSITRHGTFCSRLCCKGKHYYAGCFRTIDEAAHAYNKMAIEHFGEFAILNPVGLEKF